MKNTLPDPPDFEFLKETRFEQSDLFIRISASTKQGWIETGAGSVLLVFSGLAFMIPGIPGYLTFMACLTFGFIITGKGILEGTCSFEIICKDGTLTISKKAILESRPRSFTEALDMYVSVYDSDLLMGTRVEDKKIVSETENTERQYSISIKTKDEIETFNMRLDMKTAVWLVDTLTKTAQAQGILSGGQNASI